jgi:hypothetical protein
MTKIGSGSMSQRHGSVDPNPNPDPHQNVMDPQHCKKPFKKPEGSTRSPTLSQEAARERGAKVLSLATTSFKFRPISLL